MKKRAIIYTENMEQLPALAEFLICDDWEIISAGETAAYLSSKNIPVTEDKSLLSSTETDDSFFQLLQQITQNKTSFYSETLTNKGAIRLVCVNIRPSYHKLSDFLEESSSYNCINFKHETLIRCAAKNYTNVLVLTSPEDYQEAIIQLKTDAVTKDFRLELAGKALNLCSAYDAAISLSILMQKNKNEFPNYFVVPYQKQRKLTHGVNPHQKACLYSHHLEESILNGMKKIQGRDINYSIVKNASIAWKTVSLFFTIIKNPFEVESIDAQGYPYTTQFSPAAGRVFTVAIKNENPIGAALGSNVCQSFAKTLSCSPDILDGATLACSAVIDKDAAVSLSQSNIRTIVAPEFTKEAREILSEQQNLQLFVSSKFFSGFQETVSIDGGLLVQFPDNVLFNRWKVVTNRRPSQSQIDAMAFGTMIILAAKSDAALVVNDSAVTGIASGLPSREKSIKLAFENAATCLKNGLTSSDTNAEVLVSDTSIPFDECMGMATELGIKAIIQTGGSSTDQELIDFCNNNDISMVFTGMRHLTF